MAFTFDAIFAADPNNAANVASNAAITIFDPNDPGKAPITITDPTDSPISNPITVNKNGFGPAFKHATLDRVGWSGGGFEGFFTSYEGIKNVALEAQAAAEAAGATAAAEAAAGVAPVVAEAEAAAADAASAQAAAAASATAAANSAALVGAPADSAIAAAINGSATQTKAALSATYATTATVTGKLDKTEAATTYAAKPSRGTPVTTAAVTKAYNPNLFAYNLKPSNTRKLRAALQASVLGAQQCRIAFAGDSTTSSYNSSPLPNSARPMKFRDTLASNGFKVGGSMATLVEYDPRLAYTGTWDKWTAFRSLFRVMSAGPGSVTFTSDVPGTIVDFCYHDNSNAGGFTVSIDGGAAVQVNPTFTQSLKVYSVANLANTTHTVTVNAPTASVYVAWLAVRQANTGVIVGNFGINSSTTGDWNRSEFYSAKSIVTSWAPHATVLNLEINDAATSVPVATYKTNLQGIITTLKASGDVLLCTANPISTPGTWTENTKAIYELADTNDLPVFDLTQLYGGTYSAANAAGLMHDTLHPTSAGYALDGTTMANDILTLIDNPAAV